MPAEGPPPGAAVSLDPSRPRRIHVVGAGGAGMSAIASVLAAMGHTVTGSDLKPSPALDRLAAGGVAVAVGHDAARVAGVDVVAISSAIPPSNPEVAEARRAGVPVLTRAEVLAAIASGRRCVAVSGTHGKTTTTSLLALILVEAGLRPSFLIGGDVNEIGTNAVWDSGDWLVLEADESDGTFLHLDPEVAVLTNVEPDHLDHYGDVDALVAAFDTFVGRAPVAVAGADDPGSARLGRAHGARLVGVAADADYRLEDVTTGAEGVSFSLVHGEVLGRLALPVTGARIATNAAVATAAALEVGAPFDAARRALARFAGVARRFEARGEWRGVRFVDDYAHLPTEVAAVIEAARSTGPGRLVVVFQPHRYTRVAALGPDFADAFVGADVVVVTDVFAAGEAPLPGVSGRVVADAVERAHPELGVTYVPGRAELRAHVAALLEPGDLCLTLGAGDITGLPDEIQATVGW
ncbi:MAG TPA: UDP-N-acetylmuramate--L-alanine ligase [Acidimicrobiales bacterium]|nr:UDP-N-acetylmuramate--L-alanine ligase [Acidimicrobiales bacterium]